MHAPAGDPGGLLDHGGGPHQGHDVPAPAGFSVSLSGDDGEALRGYYQQLAVGGAEVMPLQKQVWGDEFGMCTDQFGVSWLVEHLQPQP